MSESLLERIARNAAKEGIEVPIATPTPPAAAAPAWDPELIPSLELPERSQEDLEVDAILDRVTIDEAYVKWCGKSEPNVGRKRESVMISCPKPDHPDANPSAWMNLDKDTWFCGACQEGGDKYDIAAYHFGFGVPSYKTDGTFPELRRAMAGALGYVVTRTPSGRDVAYRADEDAQDDAGAPPSDPAGDDSAAPAAAPLAPVTSIAPSAAPDALDYPSIDWRSIVPADTFLGQWMEVCSKDDLPEEFYFWLGLTAIGLAIGDDALLEDSHPVKGNLFLCLFGPTGMGKSRSVKALEQLLREALPYDDDDPHTKGVLQLPQPGSAEALVDSFSKPIHDPSDPTKVVGYGAVRAMLKIDELAGIIGRAQRSGSVIKPQLMELYDAPQEMKLRSRGFGLVRAERPYCSVVTSTQPRVIRDYLSGADAMSGFANRWIFAMGTPKKLVAIGRKPIEVERAVEPLRHIRIWAASGRSVEVVDDAAETFTEFFDEHIAPSKLDDEQALAARVDLTLKKLMLLFAVNERTEQPSADLVERVLSLHQYLVDTYTVLGSRIGSGEFNDCMNDVLTLIEEFPTRWGKQPSASDINRHAPKRYSREMLVKVLRHLEQLGMIEENIVRGKGRPTARYSVAAG